MDAMISEIVAKAGPSAVIVFVSGNFNVLHAGHLRLLRFAAEAGDLAVVGINPDNSPGVTVPATMRIDAIRSIALNLYPVLIEGTAAEFIRRLRPSIVVKGKEHETRYNDEQSVVGEYGGKLLFSSGESSFSSVSILQKNTEYIQPSIQKPINYRSIHDFTLNDLIDVIHGFSDLRVLVIGDLIVDEYVNCDPLGMSQEDPTIVVTPVESRSFIGGAGIVAAHAQGLGASVNFITVVGNDSTAEFAFEGLSKNGVQATFLFDHTRPTTRKQRFRAAGKTLLRVNHLRQHAVDHDIADTIKREVLARLPDTDLLLFSDFNYGCLPQPVVDDITAAAVAAGIVIAADSQASSQMSDISRFRGATVVTPTEREARLALRDSESGLAILAEALQRKAQARNVLITLAGEGLLIYTQDAEKASVDRLPAFNSRPCDVAGAGDSLFTCTALALCAGADIWRSAYLGSLAAALQVSRVGNTPLNVAELIAELTVEHI